MPQELYEQVKNDVPLDIGVYVNGGCIKKPKKRKLGIDEQILKNSMIRSLYREAEQLIRSNEPSEIRQIEHWKNHYKKERDRYRDLYQDLNSKVIEKYGYRWDK